MNDVDMDELMKNVGGMDGKNLIPVFHTSFEMKFS